MTGVPGRAIPVAGVALGRICPLRTGRCPTLTIGPETVAFNLRCDWWGDNGEKTS
jgi:hypothetical protein